MTLIKPRWLLGETHERLRAQARVFTSEEQ